MNPQKTYRSRVRTGVSLGTKESNAHCGPLLFIPTGRWHIVQSHRTSRLGNISDHLMFLPPLGALSLLSTPSGGTLFLQRPPAHNVLPT